MPKYKYILTYSNGEQLDSLEEYGDDNFEGTFSSEDDAVDAALYAISCSHLGAEILNLTGDQDEDYDEDTPEFYFIPSVMIGEKLNITADEYNKISQLEPAILDTDNVDEYRPLRKDEALELLDLVDKFGKKNNQ